MRKGIMLAALSDPTEFGKILLCKDDRGYFWHAEKEGLADYLESNLPTNNGGGPIGVFPVAQIKMLREFLGKGETYVFGDEIPEGEEGQVH
jgi:hypothetical protein